MKKLFSVLTLIILFGGWSALAHADVDTFTHPPSAYSTPVVWQGAPPYGNNLYWDFAYNFGATTPNYSSTYGVEPASNSLDYINNVTNTSILNYSSNGEYGLSSSNSSGSATFNVTNSFVSSKSYPEYEWVELTFDGTKTGDSINLSLAGTGTTTSTVTASEFFVNGTSVKTDPTGNDYTFTIATPGTSEVIDAWFALSNFANTNALTISFTNDSSGSTYVEDVHIATTPEPMAMALFATGVAVLFFFKRRRMGFQVA